MARNDAAGKNGMTPGINRLSMGMASDENDTYDPSVFYQDTFQDRTFPDGDIAPLLGCHYCKDGNAGTSTPIDGGGPADGSAGGECYVGNVHRDKNGIKDAKGYKGMRPATPSNKKGYSFLAELYDKDEFSDPLSMDDLRECPEGFTRHHYCNADGYLNIG